LAVAGGSPKAAASVGRSLKMSVFDVTIVGGGLAGSTAAAMLGRAGIRTALIDPHETYPADFRCEKLDASQVALLTKTGLADAILPFAERDEQAWIARFGHYIGRRHYRQYGIRYEAMVNAMRLAIPANVKRLQSKAAGISLSPDRQRVRLFSGEEITSRLVIMANGLNLGLREACGMRREVLSAAHSISIGFDLKPLHDARFPFPALTYGPERIADRIAYLTLFPIRGAMRANLFVYRDMRDPWLKAMRDAPRETLFATLPRLHRLTGDFEVASFVQIRPVDLYVTRGVEQAGIVLVGDAYSTSCPAAGTGVNKVFSDVGQLCRVHIPAWLGTSGMGAEKIAAFYADPEKIASDRHSTQKAYRLRAMSINAGPTWRARRWARVVGLYGVMALQEARARRAGMPRGSAPSRIPPATIAAGRAAEGHRRSGSNG
jgi:2-polyprenyl-6-methoxyphenol hydroxylase-like FAD-dependent oxidoreductase